jgi:hypothetical protein
MTSKFINKNNKRKFYTILIRFVVTYTCETWTLSIQDINNLLVFETQILKTIFGPNNSKEGWRVRNNNEMLELIKETTLLNI